MARRFVRGGPLRELIPDDHILKQVDSAVDFSWVEDEVRETYCEDNGRPGIAPETALRLMLAGFLLGIVHDRKLMRRAQTDLAIRWFAGYRLDEPLPNHSSLTRIRQRWGKNRFKAVLKRVVEACVDAGLVGGKTVHIDVTLIRADVSWESLSTEHAEQVVAANEVEEEQKKTAPRKGGQSRKNKPRKKSAARRIRMRRWRPAAKTSGLSPASSSTLR